MPFDPLWQLLDHTVSHKEFYNSNIYPKKDKPFFNFADSLNAYIHMNELQQLESSAYRIKEAGVVNDLTKERLVYIQMEISIIYQEKDMNLYNSAVADFNNANATYNNFVQYRNNRFIPLKPDNMIKEMLLPIDVFLSSAYKKLVDLDNSATNFQYDAGSLRNNLDTLMVKFQEQKKFLTHYLASTVPEREKLFYK